MKPGHFRQGTLCTTEGAGLGHAILASIPDIHTTAATHYILATTCKYDGGVIGDLQMLHLNVSLNLWWRAPAKISPLQLQTGGTIILFSCLAKTSSLIKSWENTHDFLQHPFLRRTATKAMTYTMHVGWKDLRAIFFCPNVFLLEREHGLVRFSMQVGVEV